MATTVYEVPADALAGAVRGLDAGEVAALNDRVYSLQDVLVVASLLANVPKFPLDMIDDVLLLADFLVTFEASTEELHRGRSNMNDVYLELALPRVDTLALPTGVAVDPHCVELVVECSSHDQGWASQNNEYNGTYDSSYTWSEIVVVKLQEEEESEATRQMVTANVRAQRMWRHHLKRFTDPSGLVSSIALGDTVQLVLRSVFPGWANTANFGRLRARFRIDICEDARLLMAKDLPSLRSAVAINATESCCVQ